MPEAEQERQAGMTWPDDRPSLTTLLEPLEDHAAEVTGVADAGRCLQWSLPDCVWSAACLIPWGRLARVARVTDDVAEVGTDLYRADGAVSVGGEVLDPHGLTLED